MNFTTKRAKVLAVGAVAGVAAALTVGLSAPSGATPVTSHADTPCPYNDVPGDANDQALKAKADAFVQGAVRTIMSSRAWTGNSAIFVVADETDYDGSNPTEGDYASVAGCCDSPVLPPGDPQISAS